MMTSSNGNIFRVTGPLCGKFTGSGEFPTHRPVTRSFDVFFDLRLNKRLSKQSWGCWFDTLSWSLWRHCNDKQKWEQSHFNNSFCIVNRPGRSEECTLLLVQSSFWWANIMETEDWNGTYCIISKQHFRRSCCKLLSCNREMSLQKRFSGCDMCLNVKVIP